MKVLTSPAGLRLSPVILMLAIGLGCSASSSSSSSSPTAPTSSGSLTAATTATVSSTVTQALAQTAGGIIGGPGQSLGSTFPCPAGGSVTTTPTVTPTMDGTTSIVAISSRSDFNDCGSQNVVIRGDPYLLTTGEIRLAPSAPGAQTLSGTSTTQTTGGLRFITDTGEGRVQYNCTLVITLKYAADGTQQISVTPSGTLSWEFPVGTPASVGPCGLPTTP